MTASDRRSTEDGKPVALVTGGGTGLGLAISRQLVGLGYRLAISYSKSEGEASAAAKSLRETGTEVSLHRVDIRSGSQVDALIAAVYETHGRLDMVVNNAGMTRIIPFADMEAADEAVWDEIMDINLKGTYLVCRAAALRMGEAGGSILNVASTSGVTPSGSSIPYGISKAGIIHLTKALAVGLAPRVRVNAIAPSTMMTRWWEGNEETVDQFAKTNRFGRVIEVDDVARAAVMLATNESISGQTLVVDLANFFL